MSVVSTSFGHPCSRWLGDCLSCFDESFTAFLHRSSTNIVTRTGHSENVVGTENNCRRGEEIMKITMAPLGNQSFLTLGAYGSLLRLDGGREYCRC